MKSIRARGIAATFALLAAGSALAPRPVQGQDGARAMPIGVAPLDASAVELLHLSRGGVLWGEVLGADERAVLVRRLDQGGRVELPWQHFASATERELRLRYGLLEIETEELFVVAQRIPLVDGREITGLIVDRTPDALHIKSAGTMLTLPLMRVAPGLTNVEVPAREIYTREELYQQRLAAAVDDIAAGGERAGAAHEQLALACEQLMDFRRALEHWQAARDLGVTRLDLASRIATAERKAAVQEQADALDAADTHRARGRYPQALADLQTFLVRYPQSPLLEDRARLETRTRRDQQRAIERMVPLRWHHWVARLARDAARDKGYAEARQWASELLGQEVIAKVTEEARELAPDIGPQDVRALWGKRPRGRIQSATYGTITFLLGADEARKGMPTVEVKNDGAPTSDRDKERQELADRIRRYLDNQRAAQRAQEGARDGVDHEALWKAAGGNARYQWIVAFYVEKGGDMQLERVGFQPCRECGGAGVLEVGFAASSQSNATNRLVPCPICYQVGVVRRVHYR